MTTVYRLTLDENGIEDVRDFTIFEDASDECEKALCRRSVFSVRLEELTYSPPEIKRSIITSWEMGDGWKHC